ncbi:serum amyloid A-2 protein-like [Pteropus medius]|uniref:serum amyloid A-2 protein-like n=1 Tax=Pteropus vampyrus TaxID=132908 RepID=UPI00196B7FF7|nr:serum amyloid A-2 protein-like [Pteropus giganteus]
MTWRDFPQVPSLAFLPFPRAQHRGLRINTRHSPQQPGTSSSAPPEVSTMKLFTGLVFCSLVLGVNSWFSFVTEAAQGAWDMWRAYSDMREAKYKGADKYFHARGNYDAARRGPGAVWAAEVIRERGLLGIDARENSQRVTDLFKYGDSGHGVEDSEADEVANRWGRSGNDPNHFRPAGLPDKYK